MSLNFSKSIKSGTDLTIITYGLGVHWAQQLAEARNDLSIEILDLRTLLPLDQEAIFEAVKKTGKVIVLHEDCMTGGIGGELVALITENCFEYLDGPAIRVASLDTPVPFAVSLEKQFLPQDRLIEAVDKLMNY